MAKKRQSRRKADGTCRWGKAKRSTKGTKKDSCRKWPRKKKRR